MVAWMTPLDAAIGAGDFDSRTADLGYREALFYSEQDKVVPALVRLRALETRQGTISDRAALLLGNLYSRYGDRDEATRVLERLACGEGEVAFRDQAWFLLAGLRTKQGAIAAAQSALDSIEGTLPETVDPERRMLQVALHTRSGDFGLALQDLQSWTTDDLLKKYAMFNLGAAMIGNGYIDDGAAILDGVGLAEGSNEEQRSLRDKANLAVGYAWLRDGNPALSREALSRVRLEGPFSNQALLVAGWTSVDDERYQRALVPWLEVSKRDPFDTAVQESMLAIPFAMVRLGAFEQAADHYSGAIESFAATTRHIDEMVNNIRDGFLADALRDASNEIGSATQAAGQTYANVPALRGLYPVLTTNNIQDGLYNLRDLGVLRSGLENQRRNINVFRQALVEREISNQQQRTILSTRFAAGVIDDLAGRTTAFTTRLDAIEASNDWLALATLGEFEIWDAAATVERHPSAIQRISESDELRDKASLIKGVLQWTLDGEFDQRLARVRQEQGEVIRALAAMRSLRREIETALEEERRLVADLKSRIQVAAPRVDSLIARVDEAIANQRIESEGLIVRELLASKQRLEANSAQARFALAAIYDLAANQPPINEVSR